MSDTEGTGFVEGPTNRRRRFVMAALAVFALCATAGYFIAKKSKVEADSGNAGNGVMVITGGEIDELSPPQKSVAERTIVIRSLGSDAAGNMAVGSGFMFAHRIALTAAHVIGDLSVNQVVVFCDGEEKIADVIWNDYLRDVAVLYADCEAETLKLDLGKLDVNEALTIIGYNFITFPDGTGAIVRFAQGTSPVIGGTLDAMGPDAGEDLHRHWRDLIRHNIKPETVHSAIAGAIRPGNSGSAVIDRDGRLVGIAVVTDRPHGRSYMVPAANIERALRDSHARDFIEEPAAPIRKGRRN